MTFEEVLQQYALPVVIMSLIVMSLIGVIKIFTKVLPNKNGDNEKLSKLMGHIYVVMVPIFSFGIVCAYFGIFKLNFDWLEVLKQTGLVWTCSQTLYPIYRDLGGRTLFKKVLTLFKGRNAKTDEIIKLLEEVMVLTSAQKETIKEKLNDKE